jgi:hypothetical protein
VLFSSPQSSDRLWDLPSLLFNGYRALTLGVRGRGREADHAPSAEIKNLWSCTSPPYVFMTWYLVKHRDNFTLHLLNRKM